MLLGTRSITSGDTRRCEVEYGGLLNSAGARGVISSADVDMLTQNVLSTVQDVSISVDGTRLFFYITGGSVVGEQFTIALQVITSTGETVNDTIGFSVVSP